jgi:hypothetical protein
MARPINVIAMDIMFNWNNISPHAEPYLDAMFDMDKIGEPYLYEPDCKGTLLYFLSNAQGWRGEDARRIKKELNAMCKEHNSFGGQS